MSDEDRPSMASPKRSRGGSGKYFIVTIVVTLAVALPTTNAQDVPMSPDGNRIEGTWDMQVQWTNCDDGRPCSNQLLTFDHLPEVA